MSNVLGVRTNIMAQNASNQMKSTNASLAGQMQKIVSGSRINKAADDASGLAISEKMRNQITALDVATDNCEDGANMIQTAEGYMGEIHDMLNRMVELAGNAANGLLDTKDRTSLQKEMDQLCGEIDRIASTANFNGKKLMDGSLGVAKELKYDDTAYKYDATPANVEGADVQGLSNSIRIDADELTTDLATATTAGKGIKLQIGETSTNADKLNVQINSFYTEHLLGGLNGMRNKANDASDAENTGVAVAKLTTNTASTHTGGISINISTQDNASAAEDGLRAASNYISDERGKLGAQQNRLEHTVNTLTTASENVNSSKSRITDTDMAKAMTKYTQTNVQVQAAQAMLAQANSQPQSILQLLQ